MQTQTGDAAAGANTMQINREKFSPPSRSELVGWGPVTCERFS